MYPLKALLCLSYLLRRQDDFWTCRVEEEEVAKELQRGQEKFCLYCPGETRCCNSPKRKNQLFSTIFLCYV